MNKTQRWQKIAENRLLIMGAMADDIADLVAVLERAEQTIRNLGNSALTGDAKQIALNEAANLRDDIAQAGE